MRLPNKFERCSICLCRQPLTWEHIIPESIGGTLESDIQCVSCNSDLGTELVSQAKSDPVIRLAIRNLSSDLPDLYRSIESGQRYTGTDVKGHSITVKFKNGKMRTEARRKEDGSLIFDTRANEKNIRQMLAKDGLTSSEIERAIETFKNSPSNTQVNLSPRVSGIKGDVPTLFPLLQAPEMSGRLITLIAYNFLCLLLADLVFDQRLHSVRQFITKGETNSRINIAAFTTRMYEPNHKLFPEFDANETRINLILFGWLVYVVHFDIVIHNVLDTVYVEDLKNHTGLLASTMEEAKRGEFYSTKGVQ